MTVRRARTAPNARPVRARGLRHGLEQGQTSEAVLIFPLVMGLVLLILQVGIWAHARSIAQSAAREGASAAAAYESVESSAVATRAALADSGDGVLRASTVSAASSAESVTVTVRGRSLSLVPGVELPPIQQSVTVPVERYVP